MVTGKSIRVGTRGSPLAVAQTKLVCAELQKIHPDQNFELVTMTTQGDRIQDRFLDQVGGKGLFVKEIEEALQRNMVDFAVHSMKDLPAQIPSDLEIACIPKRLSSADVLLTREAGGLDALKQGARIGTSSLRRRLQLARLRPDLQFDLLRGNIDTRIRKLNQGDFDGIVLARAGMVRLQVSGAHESELPILPAPGQGALALEIRASDASTRQLLLGLHDETTERSITAERKVMAAFGGDCNLPLGVLATLEGEGFQVAACLGLPNASLFAEAKVQGKAADADALVDALIAELTSKGAADIVARCRAERAP